MLQEAIREQAVLSVSPIHAWLLDHVHQRPLYVYRLYEPTRSLMYRVGPSLGMMFAGSPWKTCLLEKLEGRQHRHMRGYG